MRVLVLRFIDTLDSTLSVRDSILQTASLLSSIAGIHKYPPDSTFGRALELAVNAIEGSDPKLEEIAEGEIRIPLGDIPDKTCGHLAMELAARRIVYDIVPEQWTDRLDAELSEVGNGGPRKYVENTME